MTDLSLTIFISACSGGIAAALGVLYLTWPAPEDKGYTQDGSNPFRRHCNYCGQCQVRNGSEWQRVGPMYDIDCRCHTE